MLLSAALHFEHVHHQPLQIHCRPDPQLPQATLRLEVDGKVAFCDYNDTFDLAPAGLTADLYAKRSVTQADAARGIWPLGFHFNYAVSLHRLLVRRGFLARRNLAEIARSLDAAQLTTGSHFARRASQWFAPPADHGGRVIFFTRLWDPDRNNDPEEQERRREMNNVRTKAVRLLRSVPNAAAGVYPTTFARTVSPDLCMAEAEMRSKRYGAALRNADIGIANEGLQGSPGWKIGEYVAGSKAVITNAIDCVIPMFERDRNYALFEDVNAVPDLIADLRRKRRYREMQEANWDYCRQYLHPDVYFERLLTRLATGGRNEAQPS